MGALPVISMVAPGETTLRLSCILSTAFWSLAHGRTLRWPLWFRARPFCNFSFLLHHRLHFIHCGEWGTSFWSSSVFATCYRHWLCRTEDSGTWYLERIQNWQWRPIVSLPTCWNVHLFFIEEAQCPHDPVLCEDWLQETVSLTICSLQPWPRSAATSSFPVSPCRHQRSLGSNHSALEHKPSLHCPGHFGHNWESYSWLFQTAANWPN